MSRPPILRPGNNEKAWNDPPVFTFDSVKTASKGRAVLGRIHHASTTEKAPSNNTGIDTVSLLESETNDDSVKRDSVTAEELIVESAEKIDDLNSPEINTSCSEEDMTNAGETIKLLEKCLQHCHNYMPPKIQDDVKRRLSILEEWWPDKLSDGVKRKVFNLARALEGGDTEKANSLHLQLMVDHVSEVSQWMVGIKHIIRATQMYGKELEATDS